MTENEKEIDGEKRTDKISHINLLIAFIALISPAAYIIGLAYHQGNMNGYGIDSSNFDYSIYDIYTSFYSAINHLFSYLLVGLINLFTVSAFLYLILSFITLSLVIFFSIKIIKNESLLPGDGKIKKILSIINPSKNDYIKSLYLSGIISYLVLFAVYIFLLFSLLWCLTPYYAYKTGENVAHDKINHFIKDGCKNINDVYWPDCVDVYNSKNELILSGLFITRDQSQIAIFDGKKTVLLKLPSDFSISKPIKNNVTKN